MNQVIVVGNMGQDPKRRETVSGNVVVSLSVAINRNYKDKNGEYQQATDWVNVEAWNDLANSIYEDLHKGDAVIIIGRMKTNVYEKNGVNQYRTYILADEVGQRLNKWRKKEAATGFEDMGESVQEEIPF